jgi:hypothetical protein
VPAGFSLNIDFLSLHFLCQQKCEMLERSRDKRHTEEQHLESVSELTIKLHKVSDLKFNSL